MYVPGQHVGKYRGHGRFPCFSGMGDIPLSVRSSLGVYIKNGNRLLAVLGQDRKDEQMRSLRWMQENKRDICMYPWMKIMFDHMT